MLLSRLLFSIATIAALSARTLPIRRFEANLVPTGITEDRQHTLWLATEAGVVRFDGLHFEPVQAPAGIDLSTARQIAAGPDGSIWIGTEKGLLRYRNGTFTTALPGEITALYITRAGRILVSVSPNQQLVVCLEANEYPARWTTVTKATLTGRFQEDLAGRTWFGCAREICSWSDDDWKAAVSGTSWASLPRVRNSSMGWADIVATPDSHIWGRNGPNIVELENNRPVPRASLPTETFEGARPGFFLDRRGRLWVPGRKLHVVENGSLQEAAGAPLEEVTAIFQDRRNTLWFGLAGKGLAAIPDESDLASWAETEGINGSVLDLAWHPQFGLLAATNTGAYGFAASENRWRELGAAREHTALRSLAVGANADVLTLPHGRGLSSSGRAVPLPGGLDRAHLRKLYRDASGEVWICALSGLYKMNPNGRIVAVPLPDGTYASDIQPDAAGQLWVAYQGGVARCSGGACTLAIAPKDGLLDPRLRTIAPGGGEVWVGYRNTDAFTRFRRQGGRWIATHFEPADGYGPEDTHFLRRDRRGWIWRGSTDGVYVSDGVHTGPEDWIHLTFGDRVNASYANMYGFLEHPDGSIWIGTQKGVVRVQPEAGWFKVPPPTILSVPSMTSRQDLEVHLSQPGLPAFQSRQFRYRLLPDESKWRLSTDGIVRYAKLPAGEHRFQVAAGEGRTPAELVFQVPGETRFRAPLWIALAVVVLAAGLAWLIRMRRAAGAAQRYWDEKRAFLQARESAEHEDWSGRVLDGRFGLEQRIAEGGFAAVYRARDAGARERVAVKLLHTMQDDQKWRRRRFADEVAALQKLNHPGIVGIRHTGEAAPDRPYLVMEFVDGITLRALLAEGPLGFDRGMRLLQQIGEALAAAHRAEILHRDLKPENIMICDAGSPQERIKLIDFGIARAQAQMEQGTTRTTRLAGSPGYLAPERWVGMESSASDVYSLATIAWEMLTGESYQHGAGSAPSTLPQPVADVLTAALAYDPQQRPRDAEAFVRELCGQRSGSK